METEQNHLTKNSNNGSNGCNNVSWSSETTWIIASGSLENSVTFDSSEDTPVESDSARKTGPLILNASPVSGPCEIKLYFSQKYNIRQIYVRSTSRVYEVYYSQSQHSESEYLCTARCCVAERDDKVLHAKCYEESLKDGAVANVDKFNDEETCATSEDDWVDVKVPGSLFPDNRALSLNNTNCKEGVVQDYYEATVEISDSEPCTSVTIRFLSLQIKDCVFIDEIYVFAELVDPIHSENPPPYAIGSGGNSLMAMLFPTLLQLSKSGREAIHTEQASDKLEKINEVKILSKVADLTDVGSKIPQDEQTTDDQQYVKLQDPAKQGNINKVESLSKLTNLTDAVTEISQDEKSNVDHQYVSLQDLDKITSESAADTQHQNQNLAGDRPPDPAMTRNIQYGRIEEALEQLVTRVSKIEEVCLRFEESMLKPMNRMEMRIQRVEEQLESLAKNSHFSELPTGTRISAPSFSCDSNSSSIHTDGSDGQSFSWRPELDKKESSSGALLNPCEGMPDSVNGPHFLPSLMVTAPEFSCIEDEQDHDGLEPLNVNNQDVDVSNSSRDSPLGKPKPRLIDDVLAAALSNFLGSPSDYPPECKQTSVSDYYASQIIGNEVSSPNVKTLADCAHEVTASVGAFAEPSTYTQILTVTAPEFTSEEADGDGYSDFIQLPSKVTCTTPGRTADENYLVAQSLYDNGVFPSSSDCCNCVGNKSAVEDLVVSNDPASIIFSAAKEDLRLLETDVRKHLFEEGGMSSLGRSSSFVAGGSRNCARTDSCETVEEAGQSDSSFVLSREKDGMGQNFGYGIHVSCDIGKGAAGAEESDKEAYLNVVQSQNAAQVDFTLPLLDVKFTCDETCSSSQSCLEALWGDVPEMNLRKNGGDFGCEESSNGGDFGDEIIDPLTSKSLLVDLGIYDIVVGNSDEEIGLDNSFTSSSCPEMMVAASLI